MTSTLTAAIADLLQQGTSDDLPRFRTALARVTGASLADVDAAIAAAGPGRVVDAEIVAQERLAADRRAARTHRAAYRAWQHEEE
jgi:hypothetical protein